MSYNPRMSMAPNSQQQNRGKKKEDESDSFMRLVCTKFFDKLKHTTKANASMISLTTKSLDVSVILVSHSLLLTFRNRIHSKSR